ncbi:MAG: septum site-determining protein MinD [Actinomycetota bacterium]|nr:septum site-determining protein MinD [Actinomycetota bacterium]
MLVACWSAKGGCGTTVVAVSLASLFARAAGEALIADLAGDVPAVLGVPDAAGPGLGDWLAAGDSVPADALARLELVGPSGLRVLPSGSGVERAAAGRGDVLAALLGADARPVVADCGAMPSGARLAVAANAGLSLLVLRPCYLALRRASAFPLRPSGVILVEERGRNLTAADVEAVLGVPVRATVEVHPAIAHAVDSGSLGAHLPRQLQRSLRHAA